MKIIQLLFKIKNFIPKNKFFTTFLFFGIYIASFKLQNEIIYLFSNDGIILTSTNYLLKSIFNLIFGFLALWLISSLKVKDLAGINKRKIKNWEFLLFPLYIVFIGLLETRIETYSNIFPSNWFTLFLWVFTVGFVEEIIFRGLLQSILIKKLAKNKFSLVVSVLISSMVFGFMHLINFTEGYYGEMAQFLYAIYVGVLFGALLIFTRKIWPLILIHMLIDLVGVVEFFEKKETNLDSLTILSYSKKDFNYLVLIMLPYLIYGIYLLIKLEDEKVTEILS